MASATKKAGFNNQGWGGTGGLRVYIAHCSIWRTIRLHYFHLGRMGWVGWSHIARTQREAPLAQKPLWPKTQCEDSLHDTQKVAPPELNGNNKCRFGKDLSCCSVCRALPHPSFQQTWITQSNIFLSHKSDPRFVRNRVMRGVFALEKY